MNIDSEQLAGSILKISLSGRMDVAGVQQIDRTVADLTAPPCRAVIIELSKVDFLTSVGIRMLLIVAKALHGRGGRMVLLNPNPVVTRILELAGVDMTISVFRDVNAACLALTARAAGGGA